MSITFAAATHGLEAVPTDSEAPTLNCTNRNALDLLALAGLVPDYDGEVSVKQLGAIRSRLLRCRNLQRKRAPFCRETRQDGRVIDFGTSDAQVERRIGALLDVVVYAMERRVPLVWN